MMTVNSSDYERIQKIEEIREMNFDVLEMYSRYLTDHPRYITKKMIDEIVTNCSVSDEYAYYVLLAAACGLNLENNTRDHQIARDYLIPSIKKLDVKTYAENPYYKNIQIPEAVFGNWELKYESYQPYEAFVYNDILVDEDFREIPRLGFFDEELSFPAVLESGNEWMTITPNEIETMRSVVEAAEGNVITFGLGLGYFTYMASEKEQVKNVTVIEKDEDIIRLFEKYILPQFPHKEKIEIICMDAFDYAKRNLSDRNFDYAFVDLWHDASDGVNLYLKMRKLEKVSPNTKYFYWIENTLLSRLRWYTFEVICDALKTKNLGDLLQTQGDISDYLGNSFLRDLALNIENIG